MKPDTFTEQPVLYSKTAKGAIQQWKTYTKGSTVFFEHGKVGGKQITQKYIAEGKNAGRANARNPVEQAQFESKAAWTKQLKAGYFIDIEDAKAQTVILPMLAHRFDKQGKKLVYPCDMQRKLNGMRCLAIKENGNVRLISRGGEPLAVPHIAGELLPIMQDGDMFDGELYVHGVPLQRLISLVKDNRPESVALEYHIYDMPQAKNQSFSWDKRYLELQARLISVSSPKLKFVETLAAKSEADIIAFEKSAILNGYEGVMLRNRHGDYRFNVRSSDLLKWKRFQDAEFLVEDMTSRIHHVNGEDTLICDVCIVRNDRSDATFRVVPTGSIERKAEFWQNRHKYIGTQLMVRFLERSQDGIPIGNPVGVAFRLDEDMDASPDKDEEDENWVS